MDTGSLISLLFSGGVALAGLILVFLGVVLTAYDTYTSTEKSTVRAKYRRRASTAFWGFIAALASAVLGLGANWFRPTLLLALSVISLGASLFFVVRAAVQAVGDIK